MAGRIVQIRPATLEGSFVDPQQASPRVPLLESEPQPELDQARIDVRVENAYGRRRCDVLETHGAKGGAAGIRELWVVEGIVEIRVELHVDPFRNFGALQDGNIPVELAWAKYGADTGIAEARSCGVPKRYDGRRAKAGEVEVALAICRVSAHF